ncbi:MAG: ABC transporter ATP-binding protein [Christensenellaceae bacterium]|nr:ABC transporter ATP-binding protein [Christensenellaceae bacterium]
MSILEVSGLCKAYPSFRLEDVSFELPEGKITGFIGRNGAGKTTTLKSLLGFVHPDAGSVRFFGMDWSANEQRIKQMIGYVSGGVSFYRSKRLRVITAVTRSFYPDWDDAMYRACMERFGLDENKTPAQLSEGMKVKYAMALALSHRAKLLILDEPTSGLDPVSRDELLDILLALQREGVTILFSTHITSDLEKCADDILYIRQGRILAHDDIRRFTDSYRFVTLTEEQHARADRSLLVGEKQGKADWRSIIRTQDMPRLGLPCQKADLETIMVHLEKEA